MIYSTAARLRGRVEEVQAERPPPRPLLIVDGRDRALPPQGATIGRSRDCDVVLDDAGISRLHAELRPVRRRLDADDLGSTNGVLLNGRPLERPERLRTGDVIEIGPSSRLRADDPHPTLAPVSVALKFGFLAVLYLFLLWVARSALRDLRARRGARRPPRSTSRDRLPLGDAGPLHTAATPAWSSSARPGTTPGMIYDIGEGAVLGRGDAAEIRLEDPYASSRHAQLVEQAGVVVLEDLGSTNGTYLNEELLQARRRCTPATACGSATASSPTRRADDPRRRARRAHRHRSPARDQRGLASSSARRSSSSPTAWAARRPARSPRSSRSSTSRRRRRRRRRGARERLRRAAREANARDPRALRGRRPPRRHGHDAHRGLRRRASEVFFVHVGDSRAYRLRDGVLERITEDHSLVEELLRQGRLTAEEAEEHPQRSIITRALGPEPDVDIDTAPSAPRAGDVYLLCSDGLTSMVGEPAIAEVLRAPATSRRRRRAGRRRASPPAAATTSRSCCSASRRSAARRRSPSAGRPPHRSRAPPPSAPRRAAPEPRPQRAPAAPAPIAARRAAVVRAPAAPAAARPRMPRRAPPAPPRAGCALAGAVSLVVLAVSSSPGCSRAQAVYFVGTDANGQVTVYNGLPYTLPGHPPVHAVLRLRRHRLDARRSSGAGLSTTSCAREVARRPRQRSSSSGAQRDRRPVNQPIARLFASSLVMFALLVGFTSRWTVFEAARCAPTRTTRAPCSSRNASSAARSSPTTAPCSRAACAAPRQLPARLPVRALFARAGRLLRPRPRPERLERYRNGALAGHARAQPAARSSTSSRASPQRRRGRHDAGPARPAASRWRPRRHPGAVVAIVPSTGAIRVMASTPELRPQRAEPPRGFERLHHDASRAAASTAPPRSATRPARPSRS